MRKLQSLIQFTFDLYDRDQSGILDASEVSCASLEQTIEGLPRSESAATQSEEVLHTYRGNCINVECNAAI